MEYIIGTDGRPCTLEIKIRSLSAARLHLVVWDKNQASTVLTDRPLICHPNDEKVWEVPMPVCGQNLLISVWDEANPNGQLSDSGATIQDIRLTRLKTYPLAIDWGNPKMGQAIKLGKKFCYNLGWLPANEQGKAYCSPDKSLKIILFPELQDPKSGKESVTPMRISQWTKVMEASQKMCVPYSVPGRAVMFFHEFCHEYENHDPTWELEADLNGLSIYLGLGFSRYEALKIYQDIFYKVDTDANIGRLTHIEDFINNFEKHIKHTK